MSFTAKTQVEHAVRWRYWVRRIAWFEPFWVLAVGALLLLPARFLPMTLQPYTFAYRPFGVALLVLGWPIRVIVYREFTCYTPLDLPLFFLLLWLPVNYWASSDKALSWEAISYLVFGIALYLALLNWPPAQRCPQLIGWLILLLGIGLAVLMPLLGELTTRKLLFVPVVDHLSQRASALLPGNVNVNRVAGTLVLILPLPVALAVRRDWRMRRLPTALNALVAVLMLVALIFTQSRSAYLAAAVSIAIILVLRWQKLLYSVPVILLIGVVITVVIGPRVVLEALSVGGVLGGLDVRLELWSRALYAIGDFAFTGIGIGTFERVIPVLYPFFLIGPAIRITHAHNLLLQVSLDLGLPGLVAYLALFINTFALLAIALRQRESALNWALAAGALGGLTAMFVHGIFDAAVWGCKPAFVSWLLIALSVQVGLRATARSLAINAPL